MSQPASDHAAAAGTPRATDLAANRGSFWNTISFAAEPAFCLLGLSFVSFTTVVPTLVQRLSGSTIAVGLASGLATGVFLLPQLFVAGIVTRLRRKKPLAVTAVWIGRPLFLAMAVAISVMGIQRPMLTLFVLLGGIVVFEIGEAVQAVPWLYLLGTCIPANRRGRVLGAAQVLGGLGGVLAGMLVQYVLSAQGRWEFPDNYAVLFAAAGASMIVSAVAMTLIHEPQPDAKVRSRPGLRQALAMLPRILRNDRPFRRLAVVRVISDSVSMASAFYVLHALQRMGFPSGAAGLFVVAQVLGGLASGFLMAILQDRRGPLLHLRVTIAISALPPLLALGSEALLPVLGGSSLVLYLLLFFALGLYLGSPSWPFLNWTLEHAHEGHRPLYLGIGNALGAVAMLAPPIGGWIVARFSYPAVFALAGVFALLALVLTRRLPDTRRG